MSGDKVTITIDGERVAAEVGQSILEAARAAGIYIPSLCYHPRLRPIGSCRLCVVEIEGAQRPMTSCTTTVQEGMVVRTHTERLQRIRRDALDLILSYHPLDCPQCQAAGACELQDLVFALGIDEQRYHGTREPQGARQFATPLIRYWGDRCIMCLRCIRADHELVRSRAIDIVGSGCEASVGVIDPDRCVSCGECLQVCPVGALTDRVGRIQARPWQCEQVATTCHYCSIGCQLRVKVFEGKVIGVAAAEDGIPNKGDLCMRGAFGYDLADAPGRITRPMVRDGEGLREASWDEALSYTAAMLNKIILASGGGAIGGLVSPHATNEEAYCFQRFLREVVGTPHIDSTAGLVLGPYRMAIKEVLGRDFLNTPLDAIADSDCIVVAGGDLDENNHLIAANLVRRALWEKGARLIVLHPRQGKLAAEAECWVPLRPGTEVFWAGAMIQLLLAKGVSEAKVLKGLDALKEVTKGISTAAAREQLGLSPSLMEEAASYLAQAKRPAFIFSPPLGAAANGIEQLKGMLYLAVLCGAFGGGGVHWVGGEGNIVGVIEQGCAPDLLPGYKAANKTGLFACEQFKSGLKGMVIFGEDPLRSLPRTVVEEGLSALEFLVVQDAFPSMTTPYAHVILPALLGWEQEGTLTNCEGRVQRLRKTSTPPAGLRWSGEIVADIASFMGKEISMPSAAAVFSEIARVNPLYTCISPTGSRLRGCDVQEELPQVAFSPFKGVSITAEEGYPYSLSIEGVGGGHLFGTPGEARGKGLSLVSRTVVEMNAEAAGEMGISDGERVRIVTPAGEAVFVVRHSPSMRRDCLVLFISLYDDQAARLVGGEIDPHSHLPVYSGIPARVERV